MSAIPIFIGEEARKIVAAPLPYSITADHKVAHFITSSPSTSTSKAALRLWEFIHPTKPTDVVEPSIAGSLPLEERVVCMKCFQSGNSVVLASGGAGGQLAFHNILKTPDSYYFKSVKSIESNRGAISSIDVVGDSLIAGGENGNLSLFSIASLQNISTIKGASSAAIDCVRFVTDSTFIVSSNKLELWDCRSGSSSPVLRLNLPKIQNDSFPTRVWDVSVANTNEGESHIISTGDSKGRICLWDLREVSQEGSAPFIHIDKTHDGHVWRTAFVPGSPGTLLSCGSDARIVLTNFINETSVWHNSKTHDFQRPKQRILFDGYVDLLDFDFVRGNLIVAADDSSLIFVPSQ